MASHGRYGYTEYLTLSRRTWALTARDTSKHIALDYSRQPDTQCHVWRETAVGLPVTMLFVSVLALPCSALTLSELADLLDAIRMTGNITKVYATQDKSAVEEHQKKAKMLDFQRISVLAGPYGPCW